MKKLMIVAAAAMGLAAFGDIESTNIVGYSKSDLDPTGGFAPVAPQFCEVGKANIKLSSITPKSVAGTSLRRKIQIQLLDAFGMTTATYRWEGQSGKTWIASTTTDDVGETEIPAGQGLWVLNSANSAVDFESAGEVGTNDIIQPLSNEGGFVMVGNSFPTPIKLKDIVVSTETGTSLRRKIQIQLLDAFGTTTTTYRWEGQSGKTWIASSTTDDVGETEIPAGQAMWVLNSAGCEASMRIPAPEL